MLPPDMVSQLSADNGKTSVIMVEAKTSFPNPPFKPHTSKVQRDNVVLNSKMFNGILKVTSECLELDNSSELHTPQFDLGYEVELDYIIKVTWESGRWSMNYYDKKTGKTTIFPFDGFMYYGGK
jgi:hypothetical protein